MGRKTTRNDARAEQLAVATQLAAHALKALADGGKIPAEPPAELIDAVFIKLLFYPEPMERLLTTWSGARIAPKGVGRPQAWTRWPWEPGDRLPTGTQLGDWLEEAMVALEEASDRAAIARNTPLLDINPLTASLAIPDGDSD